jgi:hypothetical protein
VRLAVVVDDFDVVAVRVEHVGGVIAVVVAGALTRLAVAAYPAAVASAWKRRTSLSSPENAMWMFCVGSPAITERTPSDVPTAKLVRSGACRRIVRPAAGPIFE